MWLQRGVSRAIEVPILILTPVIPRSLLDGMPELPKWTDEAGGKAWLRWIDGKIAACDRRARLWASKRKPWAPAPPTRPDWQRAIWKAVLASPGRGHYSHLPLSLLGKPTDWDWPSLDHLSSPATADVVLEVRLVNDMKTIMNDQEFREMVGHLAAVLKIRPKKLRKNWHCRRGFAIEEPPTKEPPLPDTTPG